jgi:hypothetical protein
LSSTAVFAISPQFWRNAPLTPAAPRPTIVINQLIDQTQG